MARYLERLREEVPRPGPGKRVLPGIAPLLDALEPHPQTFLGLLTGNFADAAEVKLAHFDLWRYFRCGAFGEDAHDRNHLVPVALDRARGRGLPDHVDARRTVVIGDTPRDIACARAHGARVVAVATGEYPVDALEDADVVFADFSDTQAVLDALGVRRCGTGAGVRRCQGPELTVARQRRSGLAEAPGSRTQPPRQAESSRF